MATILILMEGRISLEAIMYYRKHREELKNERTLARIWLTKGKKKPYERNIIQSIDSIMKGIVGEEETKTTHKTDPLYILKDGDVLQHNRTTASESWKFKEGELVYQGKRIRKR